MGGGIRWFDGSSDGKMIDSHATYFALDEPSGTIGGETWGTIEPLIGMVAL